MTQPFCTVPFIRAFVTPYGVFRNCCATSPFVYSNHFDFDYWWSKDPTFQNFKQELVDNQKFPSVCNGCKIQEQNQGTSLRTSVAKMNPTYNPEYPKEWSINFGNVCNYACWICDEKSSSTIMQHKRRINILPEGFIDPNELFMANWHTLRASILKSYDYYDQVTLAFFGGEPTYNSTLIEFIVWLHDNGYSKRTRLEIQTNGSKNHKLFNVLNKNDWAYIFVGVSVDAIGKFSEWLRYNSKWEEVDSSIDFYIQHAHYVELHNTLSILNARHLPETDDYAKSKNLRHSIFPLSTPEFLSCESWDGPQIVLESKPFDDRNLTPYLELVGKKPIPGAAARTTAYLSQLGEHRTSLRDYDPALADILKV